MNRGQLSPSAQAILDALTCGRKGCQCQASARRGHGLTHCPGHDDQTPSMDVADKGGTVLVKCHAACEQDAVIGALRESDLWPSAQRVQRSGAGREVRHELWDEAGQSVAAVHVRRVDGSGKKISGPWWEQPDGRKGLAGRRVETLPLYGVEHLRNLEDGAVVVVTEGEPARDALHALGIPSVATVCGAAVTPTDDVLRPLARLTPILWPDDDDAGRPHMTKIAARLVALGVTPAIITWPDAPEKGDAADFAAQGETAKAVRALMDVAEPWEPPNAGDGETLLDDLVAFVRRYVVLSDAQADAVALWNVHTYAVDAADATPYLSVTSAEKRSGKTRLLETLELLVARPWLTSQVTAAVLVRKVANDQPTLLLDESDGAWKGQKEYAETLRAILNAEPRRVARLPRVRVRARAACSI